MGEAAGSRSRSECSSPAPDPAAWLQGPSVWVRDSVSLFLTGSRTDSTRRKGRASDPPASGPLTALLVGCVLAETWNGAPSSPSLPTLRSTRFKGAC